MTGSGEDNLIERFFAPLAGPDGLGLKDDAARIACAPSHDLVITCDALVAGVHFFPEDPPDAIAAKALRVNLSDLAAKGARPRGFVLALALPVSSIGHDDWLASFCEGLRADIAAYDCALLGGDTVSTPGPLMVSITAFGLVPSGCMVARTGARPDDLLYVSGTIGDSALGLALRLGKIQPFAGCEDLLERYLRPQPRLSLGAALLAHASGAMDISDGLVGDLTKMMRASCVSAEVDLAAVPMSQAALAASGALLPWRDVALTGGDDYEILASVAPAQAAAFEAAAQRAGVAVTRIGRVVAGQGEPVFREKDGTAVKFQRGSFSHF